MPFLLWSRPGKEVSVPCSKLGAWPKPFPILGHSSPTWDGKGLEQELKD